MKKLLTFALAAALLMTAACGSDAETESAGDTSAESKENELEAETDEGEDVVLDGGWALNTELAPQINEEESEIFRKAIEAGGEKAIYEPLCVLGSQVVAGMNYAFLCLKNDAGAVDPDPVLLIMVVYADLQGDAQLLGCKEIDPGFIKTVEHKESAELMTGGWQTNDVLSAMVAPQEADDAFKAAFIDGHEDATPIYCISYQVVAGMNYSYLTLTRDASGNAYLTNTLIYRDLEGGSDLISNEEFDLLYYVTQIRECE
ncbi:MAG: hypothetical protein IKR26_06400 [Lachnospiraceae bacterium]|nr:hypothetical protein [Lachnospiraceae bacterium]